MLLNVWNSLPDCLTKLTLKDLKGLLNHICSVYYLYSDIQLMPLDSFILICICVESEEMTLRFDLLLLNSVLMQWEIQAVFGSSSFSAGYVSSACRTRVQRSNCDLDLANSRDFWEVLLSDRQRSSVKTVHERPHRFDAFWCHVIIHVIIGLVEERKVAVDVFSTSWLHKSTNYPVMEPRAGSGSCGFSDENGVELFCSVSTWTHWT